MRSIKFRGKRIDNPHQWEYGYVEVYRKNVWMHTIDGHIELAIPETVGQYTGLTDKNGKEIYEGDILLYNGNSRTVEWKYGTFGLSMHKNGFPFQAFYELPVPIVDSIVVGNVHDNPQLLKGGNNDNI